jgi:ankyrin repeat protein
MAFLRFRLEDGSNILHILPTNEKFLSLYNKIISFLIHDLEHSEGESFYFSVVYPNNSGVTPLDIAISERASRSIEIMLDMLSARPHYNFSKYI